MITYHSFSKITIYKVFPGDLPSSISKEEIICDGCPEGRSTKEIHAKLFIVPWHITLHESDREIRACISNLNEMEIHSMDVIDIIVNDSSMHTFLFFF